MSDDPERDWWEEETRRHNEMGEAAAKLGIQAGGVKTPPEELDDDGGLVSGEGEEEDEVENVFCPTGPGGGIDPSCSPPGATGVMVKRVKHGGFTFLAGGRKYQEIGQKGFAVSPYPERSKVIRGKVTVKDLRAYMRKNKDLLEKPGHAFGAWHNKETGEVFLDVSIVTRSRKDAEAIGRKYNQIAAFNFKTGKEIPTEGTGK